MGEIITFYAYKGGTGRTMALANTAILLARQAKGRVLMIDWDLEAPGLEAYFKSSMADWEKQKGIFDFVAKAEKTLKKMPYGEEDKELLDAYFEEIEKLTLPVNISGEKSNLYLVRAGLSNDTYSDRINKFSWSRFYKKIPDFFPLFAKFLSKRFDYVLIDSRTGHTDIGGICTMSMPDKLVLVFTPNEQSLEGVLKLAMNAADYRMKFGDLRPLSIYPLPTRVDFNGVTLDKRLYWQEQYRIRWEKMTRKIYALPSTTNLTEYFDKVYVRHDSNYAFGEELAVLSENEGIESLSQDYRRFVTYLSYDEIWKDEPFADLTSPYQVFFLFAEADRSMTKDLFLRIEPLAARQKVITLGESANNFLSVEALDDGFRRKIGSGGVDFLVIFLSQALLDQRQEWIHEFREFLDHSNSFGKYRIVPILIDEIKDNLDFLSGIPITPTPKKPVKEWIDPDEAWLKVASDFRQRLINYHEKIKSASYA
ncbi:MAG: AAA family ATPase [Saprospiraceae bacterium]|nr:AAA family ATPase [Saprospiraceae bacterium]